MIKNGWKNTLYDEITPCSCFGFRFPFKNKKFKYGFGTVANPKHSLKNAFFSLFQALTLQHSKKYLAKKGYFFELTLGFEILSKKEPQTFACAKYF